MPDQWGNPTEAERRQAGMAAPPSVLGNSTMPQMAGPQTYTNGHHFAGTNVPMSDAAYALLSNNGTQAIATDRDVSGQGTWDRISNAASFELDRAGNLIKGVVDDPSRLLTGVDPLSTDIHNSVLGTDKDPLVGQLGGATEADFQRYEAEHGFGSLGAARSGSAAADYLAGMFGAVGAANGIGNAFGNGATQFTTSNDVGGLSSALPEGVGPQVGSSGGSLSGWGGGTNSGLGVFGEGSMAGVGGGNAGALAARGGIAGGAGTGIGGSLGGGSGWLSQDAMGNYADLLGGLTGGGKGGGGSAPAIPWNANMLGNQSQPQQQQASAPLVGLPINTPPPFIPPKGYKQRNFLGATIWS